MMFYNTNLTTSFPIPQLTKVVGKPNHITYQIHSRELVQSLGSHPTHLGGGQHGYIPALAIGNANLHNTLTNGAADFDVPEHPGANPTVPEGATQHQIQEANRIHQRDLAVFTDYHGKTTAAKTALIEAVGEEHFHSLKHRITAFHNVTLAQVFALYGNNYSEPDPDDLDANGESLRAVYNPSVSVATTIAKKKDCQHFAYGTASAITDAALLFQIKRGFTKSGIKEFKDAIDKFESKPNDEQTLVNLESELTKAENKYQKALKEHPTAAEAGYNTANAVIDAATIPTLLSDPKHYKIILDKIPYCYTHGCLPFQKNHTSKTCRNKCAEHKEDATFYNMMGGNNFIQRKRGDQPGAGWSNKGKKE